MFAKLLQYWRKASLSLGFGMIAPFQLSLASGKQLDAIFLVENFGNVNGMLVFGSYDEISSFVDEIVDAGYGYTVLEDPMDGEEYCEADYIELLSDWAWSGDEALRPDWLEA